MKVHLVWVFILLSFFSCANKEEEFFLEHDKYLKREINFEIDDSTSNEFIYSSIFEDENGSFLVALNTFTNSVDMYSFEESRIYKRIYYKNEGPEGLNAVAQGFTFSSLDSIFIYLKGNIKGSIIIDENSNFIGRLNHSIDTSLNYYLINHVSSGGNPTIKSGDYLYFTQYPLFDTRNPSNISSDYPLSLNYNLKTNEVLYDSISSFPKEYVDNIWSIYDLVYSRTILNDSIELVSWPLLDSLILIDRINKNIKYVNGKSKYFKSDLIPFQSFPSQEKEMEVSLGDFRYKNIIYDHYRELFYRIVRHPLKDLKGKRYFPNIYEQSFSVIVLDRKFNTIKEILFPGSKYSFNSPLVCKEGLAFLANNILDPDLDEDYLSLQIFDFTND